MTVYLLDVRVKDYDAYQKLIESSEEDHFLKNGKTLVAKQQRNSVHKEIRFSDELERLHFNLHSKQSELVLSDDGKHTEMLENMEGVRCFIQEELYYLLPDGRELVPQGNGQLLLRHEDPKDASSWFSPQTKGLVPMQKIRYLEAEKAAYYYKTNSFLAREVEIKLFLTKGHELIEIFEEMELIMRGLAQSVEFSLGGKNVNFRAHHLTATFYSPKGLL